MSEHDQATQNLVAIRFQDGADVDRAIDVIFGDPVLSKLPFDSPDGYELHVSETAVPILRNHGLKFKSHHLTKDEMDPSAPAQ